MFSQVDAMEFHTDSVTMAQLSFTDAIIFSLFKWGYDDIGVMIIISSVYRIIESELLINYLYLIVGYFTTIKLFGIGKIIMNVKYAFIMAFTFTAASFMMFFYSTLLKETIMVFLIVSSFSSYIKYVDSTRLIFFMHALLWASLLVFFRPVLFVFICAAYFLTIVIKNRFTLKDFFPIIVFVIVVFFSFEEIIRAFNRYTMGGDILRLLEVKESQNVIRSGGLAFNYAVNFISQLVGPFPSLSPDYSIILSYYSFGLIYRVLLFVPFIVGSYVILKSSNRYLYPLLIFCVIQMGSLLLILEGLELRLSITHIPIIYIIGFWFLYNYDILDNLKYRRLYAKSFTISLYLLLVLILFYNTR